MEIKEVPQDKITTYAGYCKLMYATKEEGGYTTITSCGWDAEEFANKQAVLALEEEASIAYEQARQGEKSPLYFYMFYYRHDLVSLSQSVGLFKWRVKRHLELKNFNKLSDRILLRYADIFDLSIAQLKTLPDL